MAKRVLAVDDSKTMRDMVNFTLKNAGYEVIEAEDGLKALALAKAQSVDVILTDINMPNMDGISLVKELRAQPQYRSTPILILTTEGGDDKKAAGRAAGATGWIVKPFSPDKLIAVINKVCP
ncbi:response regulator [Asticcacaulis benevestitus]|uniref:Chemotaxis protein CheY n=1 Tax=Asticcacaulis benevestitus DSM 16100 = ATCC BAA-896 TaxID=1121022 RepID=V4PZF2_9CAUL|nr:response regulator [Asticcacaulis benevestitus]ESQ92804.1 chemotaxis protein CheY [Asticcacaulis benevestitus DSM 16100 = ATCC BAA-896]